MVVQPHHSAFSRVLLVKSMVENNRYKRTLCIDIRSIL